jgi:hypothetical protein
MAVETKKVESTTNNDNERQSTSPQSSSSPSPTASSTSSSVSIKNESLFHNSTQLQPIQQHQQQSSVQQVQEPILQNWYSSSRFENDQLSNSNQLIQSNPTNYSTNYSSYCQPIVDYQNYNTNTIPSSYSAAQHLYFNNHYLYNNNSRYESSNYSQQQPIYQQQQQQQEYSQIYGESIQQSYNQSSLYPSQYNNKLSNRCLKDNRHNPYGLSNQQQKSKRNLQSNDLPPLSPVYHVPILRQQTANQSDYNDLSDESLNSADNNYQISSSNSSMTTSTAHQSSSSSSSTSSTSSSASSSATSNLNYANISSASNGNTTKSNESGYYSHSPTSISLILDCVSNTNTE